MSREHRKSRDPLYHYTCAHGFAGISETGILLPGVHPLMRHLGPLLWLTDLPAPSEESVGLTSERLTCDRMTYRYIVHTHAAVRWYDLNWRVSRALVDVLEAYGEPAHWWVVRRPLLASEFALDGTYIHQAEVSA
jgi:hypothetical protein